ncbi:MAG TPA: hypothetical protein VJ932_06225, partial [Alkalispirochaeta sp.]|nr:hypothetical protein [Alkalispirochaeta sp.]
MAVVLILCAGLAACTTSPFPIPAPPDGLHSSWNTETFTTADPEVPVTVVFLDPAPGPAHASISITSAYESRSYPQRALSLGTTPWRRSFRG